MFASLIACGAYAAELGEPRVVSHIGQQLVADVELTQIEDANTKVEVNLASPDVYNGAGIAVPPVLSSLNLSVMRRDGRQFLHATTLRPVQADHLHLYLELVDHGQRVVRLVTLWLTPDPNPAPAAAALPTVAPAAAMPAPRVERPAPVRVPAAAQARARAEAESEPAPPALAWTKAALPDRASPAAKANPSLPAQALSSVKASPSLPAQALPPAKLKLPLPAPMPVPLPVHAAARPAACQPQSGEAEACVALGAKNAELRARIGQLEQRVKGLQASLGAGPQGKLAGKTAATPPASAASAAQKPALKKPAPQKPAAPDAHAQPPKPPARPAGPAPIASIKPLLPHEAKAAPSDDDLPWGPIAAGLAALAALGAAAALLRARRKRVRKADIPAQSGMLPKLRERFFARNGAHAQADPVLGEIAETTLE